MLCARILCILACIFADPFLLRPPPHPPPAPQFCEHCSDDAAKCVQAAGDLNLFRSQSRGVYKSKAQDLGLDPRFNMQSREGTLIGRILDPFSQIMQSTPGETQARPSRFLLHSIQTSKSQDCDDSRCMAVG